VDALAKISPEFPERKFKMLKVYRPDKCDKKSLLELSTYVSQNVSYAILNFSEFKLI
jgi:hypothetical protein